MYGNAFKTWNYVMNYNFLTSKKLWRTLILKKKYSKAIHNFATTTAWIKNTKCHAHMSCTRPTKSKFNILKSWLGGGGREWWQSQLFGLFRQCSEKHLDCITYNVGVHDTPSPFSLNLLFYTTHFTICLEVRWTSLKSMIHPKLFLRNDMKDCLSDTYNRKQLHFE